MFVHASTAPEFYPSTPGAQTVEGSSIYDELREKIVSGEVKLNFSYLPPRAIGPENLSIDPTKFSLGNVVTADDDPIEEKLLGEIDDLLDKLVSGGDPNKPPERVIYL